MSNRQPPEGIERLTPAAAWQDGYRIGREDLAASMTRDAAGEAVKDSRVHDRLDELERALKVLRDDATDRAGLVVKIEKRVEKLEGGKVE